MSKNIIEFNTNNGNVKKNHNYTQEQEKFIAKKIATPEIWELLFDSSDANSFYTSKKSVRTAIVKKFNEKFTTETTIVNITEFQLKNKIHSMVRSWKQANSFISKTEKIDSSEVTPNKILEMCHFYYIWQPFALPTFSSNPRQPVQLTKNIQRKRLVFVVSEDEEEENEENDDDNRSETSNRPESCQSAIQSTIEQQESPKKKRKYEIDLIGLIGDLFEKINENAIAKLNIEKQQLKLEERRLLLDEKNVAIQERINLATLRKLEAEERLQLAKLRKLETEEKLELAKLEAMKAIQNGKSI